MPHSTAAQPLPASVLRLVLFGPWIVVVVGLALVIASFPVRSDAALATASLSVGAGLLVAGAVLPRVKGTLSGLGISGELMSVPDAMGLVIKAVDATIAPDDPERPAKLMRAASGAFDALAAAAGKQGWTTVTHTAGSDWFSLSRSSTGEGTPETVLVNFESMLKAALDAVNAPAPAKTPGARRRSAPKRD